MQSHHCTLVGNLTRIAQTLATIWWSRFATFQEVHFWLHGPSTFKIHLRGTSILHSPKSVQSKMRKDFNSRAKMTSEVTSAGKTSGGSLCDNIACGSFKVMRISVVTSGSRRTAQWICTGPLWSSRNLATTCCPTPVKARQVGRLDTSSGSKGRLCMTLLSVASLKAAKSDKKKSMASASFTSFCSRISMMILLSEVVSTQASWWSGTSRNVLASV